MGLKEGTRLAQNLTDDVTSAPLLSQLIALFLHCLTFLM